VKSHLGKTQGFATDTMLVSCLQVEQGPQAPLVPQVLQEQQVGHPQGLCSSLLNFGQRYVTYFLELNTTES